MANFRAAFGDRLKVLRKRLGYSQETMANLVEISRTSWNHYEKERYLPTLETLIWLTKRTNVRWEWLVSGSEPMMKRDYKGTLIEDLPQPVVTFSSAGNIKEINNSSDYLAVPLMIDPIAAGAPTINTDAIDEWAWIHISQIGKRKNLVAIRVAGRSMHPLILNGAIVAIDRDDHAPPGLFAVRCPDEGVTIKRVKLMGKNNLLLTPENREYDERLITLGKGESLYDVLIGRAVWQWSDLTEA